MEFNLADLFEVVADKVPDRKAVIAGDRRSPTRSSTSGRIASRTTCEMSGCCPGQHVGVYAFNRAEWVETMIGCYKARAVPINVNYRYVVDELRYLFDNADLVALIFEAEFGPHVASVLPGLPKLKHLVQLERRDGHGDRRARGGRVRARAGIARRQHAMGCTLAPPTTCTSSTRAGPPACPRA